jgi:hypothetical protein
VLSSTLLNKQETRFRSPDDTITSALIDFLPQPPAPRGQLAGMYEIGWQIGGLVGFWINYGE